MVTTNSKLFVEKKQESKTDNYNSNNNNNNDNNNNFNNDGSHDINIESIQEFIARMNVNIEDNILSKEKQDIFVALFESGLIECCYTPYFSYNSIVQLLKNHFSGNDLNGEKYDKSRLSLQSEINLKCAQFILDNVDILKTCIANVLEPNSSTNINVNENVNGNKNRNKNKNSNESKKVQSRSRSNSRSKSKKRPEKEKNKRPRDNYKWKKENLEYYFINYRHKCKISNDYMKKYNYESFDVSIQIMDILRNLLFQIGIICRLKQICDIYNIANTVYTNPRLMNSNYDYNSRERERHRDRERHRERDRVRKLNILNPTSSHYTARRQAVISDAIFNRIDPNNKKNVAINFQLWLDLGLIDPSIQINGISLYHLFVSQERNDLLEMLFDYGNGDWSLYKDNNNQV